MTRLEVMLGTLLAVVILGVAILAGVVFLFPKNAAPAPAVAPTAAPLNVQRAQADTAIIGYAAAQRAAALWSGDSQLVSVTATWVPGSESDGISDGSSSWGYTFYSPASGRSVVVTVQGAEGSVVYELPLAVAPAPLPPGNWRQDSTAILATLLHSGGETFLRQDGDATVTMSLTMNPAAERAEWFVSLISARTGRSITMLVDATSGEVLELDGPAT